MKLTKFWGNQIKGGENVWACSMGKMINAYTVLVRKLECKRPLGRPRHKWEDNIKMDNRKIRWKAAD
jgi:hypothetical protein